MKKLPETVLLSLLFVLIAISSGPKATADTPSVEDLQIDSIKKTGMSWRITGSVDIFLNDDADDEEEDLFSFLQDRVTLVYRVYDKEVYDVDGEASYTFIEPRRFKLGKDYLDYKVRFFMPSLFTGESVIAACLQYELQGNDDDEEEVCTTWTGWIPQKPELVSSGSVDFDEGTGPRDNGTFTSEVWTIDVKTDLDTDVYLVSEDLPVSRLDDSATEIDTWWKFWDEGADDDGVLEAGEEVDTGWVKVESYSPNVRLQELTLPAGWDGELYVQLKMERNGLDDRVGYYSANLRLDLE